MNEPSRQPDVITSTKTPSTLPAGVDLFVEPPGIDDAERWAPSWEGKDHGADISVIHLSTSLVGFGPPLHRHPYPEIIVIRSGQADFRLGEETLRVSAGCVVVVPAGTAHTFRTLDSGRYESIAVHQSPEFVSEEL